MAASSDYDDNWWRHAVFYQIYPRSFMDSNNDGIGDLQGIIAKLPHLADLGITATWLSPIFESPMIDFGYDISNFTAIQPEYGSMQDFEALIAKARELDIKVILDFVPNHTSDQCEWFRQSAERAPGFEDFYVWADGRRDEKGGEPLPPNNWQSVFYGSAWSWHPQRQQFYLHQFTAQQPDLNFRCPAVCAAISGVLLFWLDKGVSGFRVDALSHLFEAADLRDEPLAGRCTDPKSYDFTEHIYTKDLPEAYEMLQSWQKLLLEYTQQHGGHRRILMTECMTDLKAVMDYYEDERGRMGAQFSFNFLLIDDVRAVARRGSGSAPAAPGLVPVVVEDASNAIVDARDIVSCIQKWLTYMPRGHVPNWVLGNHDRPRLASRLGRQMVDVMHMLLLTLPGVAVTYNGEEIGMEDNRDIAWEDTVDPAALNVGREKFQEYSRDPARTPFQWSAEQNGGFSKAATTWLPVHRNHKTLNLEQQKREDKSHYHVYRRLIELRRMPTLRQGHFHIEVLSRHVLAIKRSLKDHPTVLVILNVSASVQPVKDLQALFPADGLPEEMELIVASGNSNRQLGGRIPLVDLKLAPHEGLVGVLH